MPSWVEIELLLLPVVVIIGGGMIAVLMKFAKVEAKVEMLEDRIKEHEANDDSALQPLAEQLVSIDGKLDRVSERLSHFEGYMERDREK